MVTTGRIGTDEEGNGEGVDYEGEKLDSNNKEDGLQQEESEEVDEDAGDAGEKESSMDRQTVQRPSGMQKPVYLKLNYATPRGISLQGRPLSTGSMEEKKMRHHSGQHHHSEYDLCPGERYESIFGSGYLSKKDW